jgi:hypothetical protein
MSMVPLWLGKPKTKGIGGVFKCVFSWTIGAKESNEAEVFAIKNAVKISCGEWVIESDSKKRNKRGRGLDGFDVKNKKWRSYIIYYSYAFLLSSKSNLQAADKYWSKDINTRTFEFLARWIQLDRVGFHSLLEWKIKQRTT